VTERYFTLAHANELVPRVHASMQRLLQLHAHLRATSRTLLEAGIRVTQETLAKEGEPSVDDPMMRQRLQQARGLYEAVREAMAEIEALGAEVKDVEQGLVDFPSLLDGQRAVLLCWKLGEKSITHYHETDAGFTGRKPVEGLVFTDEPRVRAG
jgi:hypothetical protein